MLFLSDYGHQHYWALSYSSNKSKMDANAIVFWFSGFVSICVVIWAILIIRAYDKVDRDNK